MHDTYMEISEISGNILIFQKRTFSWMKSNIDMYKADYIFYYTIK